MAHYSIWIPGGTGPAPAMLESVGLGDLCSEGDLSPSVMELKIAGPCGGVGALIQWLDPSRPTEQQPRLGFHKEEQAWSPLPAFKLNGESKPKGSVWIGAEKDRPLTPDDLLRRSTRKNGKPRYGGSDVVLGDDRLWHIPNMFSLPMEFAIDPETGEDKKVVIQASMPIWSILQEALTAALDVFLKDQNDTWNMIPEENRSEADAPQKPSSDKIWTEYDVLNFDCWALSLNYRITKLIAVTGHLFNNNNLWSVLFEATDQAAIWKLQVALKKTEATYATYVSTISSGGAPA